MQDQHKRCSSCGETKPYSDFYMRRRYGTVKPRPLCKACTRAQLDAHEVNRVRRPKTFAEHRRDLLKMYGMTLAQYDELLAAQDGGCAICAAPTSPDGRSLAVDHCHATGAIRGLLCAHCNRAIGLFEDNAGRLRAAAAYLEHPTVELPPGRPSRTARLFD